MKKKPLYYILLSLLLLISVSLDYFNKNQKNLIVSSPGRDQRTTNNNQTYLVSRVIDGDTIEITGGQKVRYIGVDAPETVDPRRAVGCFGEEATNKNKDLVLGKEVRLEKDVSETDKYGRLLRYVYVGDIFVNKYLVSEGFARASSYPPDIKYQDVFRALEKTARENNKGLWSTC